MRTVGLLLLTVVVFASGNPSARGDRVEVWDGRPIREFAREIERRYGFPVTYEDPPFLFSGEIEDVTLQSGLVKGHKPVFAPKKVRWDYDVPLSVRSADELSALLSQAIRAFNNSSGATEFSVDREGGVFHLVPAVVLDAAGKRRAYRSLLAGEVSIPPKKRTGNQAISAVIEAVRKSGAGNIDFLFWSPSELDSVSTEEGFEHVRAWEAITRVLARSRSTKSWKITCIPGWGQDCHFAWKRLGE